MHGPVESHDQGHDAVDLVAAVALGRFDVPCGVHLDGEVVDLPADRGVPAVAQPGRLGRAFQREPLEFLGGRGHRREPLAHFHQRRAVAEQVGHELTGVPGS